MHKISSAHIDSLNGFTSQNQQMCITLVMATELHLHTICINGNCNAFYACQRAIANGISTSQAF